MHKRLILLSALVLIGCRGDAPADKPRMSKKERAEAAELALSRTPDVRTYRIDGNELKVFEVPVKDSSNFVDVQRCFVWRDAEYRTSTISCGQQPDVLLSN